MALHQAVQAENEALIQSLIKDGADIHELNKSGETPLHALVAKKYSFWDKHMLNEEEKQCIKEEHQHRARIAKILIQAGADVNRRRRNNISDSFSILHTAATTNNEFIVDLLLENGADVNNAGVLSLSFNTTILHSVLYHFEGNINIVKSLLEHGADVNGINNTADLDWTPEYCSDETVLHIAVRKYSNSDFGIELIKLLLKYEADVNASHSGRYNVIESYLGNYFSVVELNYEYEDRCLNSEVLKLLIPLSTISISPLHQACMFNEYNYVRELCKKSDVNIDATDKFGHTPLFYAVVTIHGNTAESQESKVKLLLSLGADIYHQYYYSTYNSDLDDSDCDITKSSTLIDYLKSFDPEQPQTTTTKRLRNMYSIFLQRAAVVTQLNSRKIETFPFYWDSSDDEHYDWLNHHRKTKKILRNEWANYLREIKMTKQYIVSDGVSFFDLLVADSKKSSEYIKNKNIIDGFEMKLLKRKFPIYHDWILHTYFGLALERRKLLDIAAIQLCRIFKFSDPNNEFFVITASRLSNQDLRVLLGIEEMSIDDIIEHEFVWDPSSDYPRVLM